MIMALDHEVGNILATIDLEDTVVIFLSDNGTPSHAVPPGVNENQVKGSMYDRGVNVPLFVAGPGLARGVTVTDLVQTVDLFATLAEIAGLTIPDSAAEDSVSFAAALDPVDLESDGRSVDQNTSGGPASGSPAAPGPAGGVVPGGPGSPQLAASGSRDWAYSELWVPNGPNPKILIRLMARNRTHKLMYLDDDGDGPMQGYLVLFAMEGEQFIEPGDYTAQDLDSLTQLQTVMAARGPWNL